MDYKKLLEGIVDSLPPELRDEINSRLESGIPKSWLRQRIDHENTTVSESLTKNLQPGDEVWRYRSSEASWRSLAGREGFAIVREGTIVYHECYMMS